MDEDGDDGWDDGDISRAPLLRSYRGGDGMVRQPWRGLREEEEEEDEEDGEDGDEYGRVRTSTTPTGEGWVRGWDGDQDEEEGSEHACGHRQSAGLAGNMNSSAAC